MKAARPGLPKVTLKNCVTAVVAGACAGVSIAHGPSVAESYVTAFLCAVLVILARIDLERRVLPNRIVLPAAAVVLAAQLAFYPSSWAVWLIAAVVPFVIFLLFALAIPAGIGMGDVKLMLLLGAGLGRSVTAAVFVGVIAAGLWSLLLLAIHGKQARRRTFAYGPFLAGAAIAVALLRPPAEQVSRAKTLPVGPMATYPHGRFVRSPT